jgi:hypothetical protein
MQVFRVCTPWCAGCGYTSGRQNQLSSCYFRSDCLNVGARVGAVDVIFGVGFLTRGGKGEESFL